MRSPLAASRRFLRSVLLPAPLALVWGLGSAAPCAAQEKITFQDHVRPIFESACNSCHNPDKKKGGLDLSSYAAMMAGGSSGEIAASGDAAGSRLYACVTKAAEPFMPPQGDGLAAPQLDIIKRWIEGGLLDTPDGVARKAKKPAFSAQVAGASLGKPDGPPPMPENLLLEPVVTTRRASATAALAASPWAPLVALSGQRQVLLYNTDTLELAGVLPFADGSVESLIFSRDGRLVVAGTGIGGKSGKVVAWEVTTGKKAFEVGEERDTVLAADLSADQSIVALGGPSRRVKLYATADGALIKDLKKHTDWVTALQFSPDGVLLATGDRAGGLQVWEGRSGNEYFTLPGHTAAITAVSWRADGNILASASEDGTVRLWEMNEGKEVKKWNAHGGGVQSLAFAQDGRLVSCGRDQHVKVWNQEGAQAAAQNKFSDLTLAACFSHDGARFIAGDWSGRISVWNTADAAAVGDMSAAPPSIDQRLAVLAPERDQARASAAAAAAAMAAMQAKESAARAAMESARQTVTTFQDRSRQLEHSLSAAKAAAETLLARLAAPTPEPPPAADAAMDLNAAAAMAADLQSLTTSARTSLGPMGVNLGDLAQAFAGTVPGQLAETRQRATAMEAEMSDAQQQAATAVKTHEAATSALQQHEQAVARWEAAKINTQVFHKKGDLFALTATLEDLTATLAALEGQADSQPDRVAELQKEKAALEAQAASLQAAIDAETARYLSALPK
jgi:chaperonin cofactor prefoldin